MRFGLVFFMISLLTLSFHAHAQSNNCKRVPGASYSCDYKPTKGTSATYKTIKPTSQTEYESYCLKFPESNACDASGAGSQNIGKILEPGMEQLPVNKRPEESSLKAISCSFEIQTGKIDSDLITKFSGEGQVKFDNAYSRPACSRKILSFLKKSKDRLCTKEMSPNEQQIIQVKATGATRNIAQLDKIIPCDDRREITPIRPPVEQVAQPQRLPSSTDYNENSYVNASGRTYSN